jgi:hypothetical protein
MTDVDQARKEAQALSQQLQRPVGIWRHVGGQAPGRYIPPSHRLLVRETQHADGSPKPEPRYAWAHLETVQPTRSS